MLKILSLLQGKCGLPKTLPVLKALGGRCSAAPVGPQLGRACPGTAKPTCSSAKQQVEQG